jgi:integrase
MRGSRRERRPGVHELRVYVGRDHRTGRPRYLSRTFRGGVRDAETALAELVAATAGKRDPAGSGTVADLLDAWLEHAAADLAPTTLAEYRRIVETRLRPELGPVRLRDLSAVDLERLYGRLTADGLSPVSVRHIHALIRRALGTGVRWNWLERNVAVDAEPPRGSPRAIEPPELATVLRLIALADETDPDLATVARVALGTGARRGEICALRWNRVELELGYAAVTVDGSVSEVSGELERKSTKTGRSRVVAIDERTVAALLVHRSRVVERLRLCLDVDLDPAGYVFSRDPAGREPLAPSVVSDSWARLSRRAGLRVRFHDLRHAHASYLLAAGLPVPAVAARLGHADPSTTLRTYAHALAGQDRTAADAIGELLAGPGRLETELELGRVRLDEPPLGAGTDDELVEPHGQRERDPIPGNLVRDDEPGRPTGETTERRSGRNERRPGPGELELGHEPDELAVDLEERE